jgi:hypothetical protein
LALVAGTLVRAGATDYLASQIIGREALTRWNVSHPA